MIVLFDIDGVLADTSTRMWHLEKPKKDWNGFFKDMEFDDPIIPMCKLCSLLLLEGNVTVFFITGRPEKYRNITVKWLFDVMDFHHSYFDKDRLFMRPDKDGRKDNEVKLDALNKIRSMGYKPTLVFEDRNRNCEMYRKEGLICCNPAANGDF